MKRGFRVGSVGAGLIGLAGLIVFSLGSGSAAPEPTPNQSGVELKVVKYRDLVEAVKAQRGKVVAIDVWATWCKPCREHFPHLVSLHEKYKNQGLVCMSVSLDMTPDPKTGKPKAERFLTEQKATFPNYLLEEPQAILENNWKTGGPPVWFVFDRQGRRAGKFTSDDPDKPIPYEKIDELVIQLLQAQP